MSILLGADTVAAWRTGASFSSIYFLPDQTFDFVKVRAVSDKRWFHFGFTQHTNWDSGAIKWTRDAGVTWATYPVPAANRVWQDIIRAANGVWWGLTTEVSNNDHCEIWKSLNEGDTWIEVNDNETEVGQNIFMLVTHPTDSDIIVALGSGNVATSIKCIYTLNGGASWASNSVSSMQLGWGHQYGSKMTASGRILIVALDSGSDLRIWASDDYGATWNSKLEVLDSVTTDDVYGVVGEDDGSRLFVMIEQKLPNPDEIRIYTSVDDGDNWTNINNDPPRPDTNADYYDFGMAYDPIDGYLYLAGAGKGNTNNVWQVARLAPPYTGSWEDYSDSLLPIGSGTPTSISGDRSSFGIAAIPPTEEDEEGGQGPPGEGPPVSDSPTEGIIESSQASNYIGLCGGIGVFARQPFYPFTIIAGPFYPADARRTFVLSNIEDAQIELSINDIRDPAWLLPGACWSIESGCEEVWLGFIDPGEIGIDADSVGLSLEGPTSLLSIEAGVSERVQTDLGSALLQFLESAQSRDPVGIFPGNIIHSVFLDTSVRGETIIDFLRNSTEEAGVDWKIRAERLEQNGIALYLDVGDLHRETQQVIVKEDIIAGILRQFPITSSVTAFGASDTFEGRNVATVNAMGRGPLGGNRMTYPPDAAIAQLLAGRNIGPAANRHRSLIFERVGTSLESIVTRRMTQEALGIDEILITLDQDTFADMRIGDIVSLNVVDWIPGLSIDGRFQVRSVEPNEDLGDKDVVLWSIP